VTILTPGQLRARFATALSALYAREVPAYQALVDTATAINRRVVDEQGESAERLGDLHRVTAERHGAIRVGTAAELRQLSGILAALGMEPVGFYDLREAGATPIPVVSTAFRPISPTELADNPFRLFVSVLVAEDARFFDAELSARVSAFLARRTLFGGRVLTLAERCVDEGGLPAPDGDEFVRLAVDCFRLTREPVDRQWYEQLSRVSSVAADIAGVPSTHINHLTPRVLDIDALYREMHGSGVEMIPRIEGPPRWEGPDVLLRQTSFRALAEPRVLREPDGRVHEGALRVRFGEVEARGVALTAAGRQRYDEAISEAELLYAEGVAGELPGSPTAQRRARDWPELLAEVWRRRFPSDERSLACSGLACYTVHAEASAGGRAPAASASLDDLLQAGLVGVQPVVYEDFLPRSAAGIFRSNLTSGAQTDTGSEGAPRDSRWLAGVLERPVHDPQALYRDQVERSVRRAAESLGIEQITLPG
jgi:uncharacterized glyoxalase superfamily metalloenzyme YdcJ